MTKTLIKEFMKNLIIKYLCFTLYRIRLLIDSYNEMIIREGDALNSKSLDQLTTDIEALVKKIKTTQTKLTRREIETKEEKNSPSRNEIERIFKGKVCPFFKYSVFKDKDILIYTSLGSEKFPDDFKPIFLHDCMRFGTSKYAFPLWKNIVDVKFKKCNNCFVVTFFDKEFKNEYKLSWDKLNPEI